MLYIKGIQDKNNFENFWQTNFSLLFEAMSVGLAWKSPAKSNEKLVNQTYAALFLS